MAQQVNNLIIKLCKKTFITTKIVDAIPMQALQAELNNFRTNDVPSETAGYKVTYEDGYESWCPKEVFDKHSIELKSLKSFGVICHNNYPDYIKRMFNEQFELEDKINKIQEFTDSNEYFELSTVQKDLLIKQYKCMQGYINVLRERIIYEISIPVE